jgi:hypothetical protein
MPVSKDTLLRLVRARAPEAKPAPRVIGIDDWAWKRGHRYGTIVCDLERHEIVDLLPDREAATVEAWLADHPAIEIVSREEIKRELGAFANAEDISWVQEEPANQGAWSHIALNLLEQLGGVHLRRISRPAAAAPSTGSPRVHEVEQQALIDVAVPQPQ